MIPQLGLKVQHIPVGFVMSEYAIVGHGQKSALRWVKQIMGDCHVAALLAMTPYTTFHFPFSTFNSYIPVEHELNAPGALDSGGIVMDYLANLPPFLRGLLVMRM